MRDPKSLASREKTVEEKHHIDTHDKFYEKQVRGNPDFVCGVGVGVEIHPPLAKNNPLPEG